MISGLMSWLWWSPAVDVHVYILDLMNVSCLWRIEISTQCKLKQSSNKNLLTLESIDSNARKITNNYNTIQSIYQFYDIRHSVLRKRAEVETLRAEQFGL